MYQAKILFSPFLLHKQNKFAIFGEQNITLSMKKTFYLLAAFTLTLTAAAQQKDGGISQQMLQEIISAQPQGATTQALSNAIATNNIDDLARTRNSLNVIDKHFCIETPKQSITNQKSSGRCWMFSGLNVLRADFARLHKDSLQLSFSQDYLFFYDQLEKANLFLQGIIDTGKKPIDDQRVRFFLQNPIGDGGTFCGVSDLTEKYGLVPTEVCPETYSADNTTKMRAIIKSKLREQALQLRDLVQKGTAAKTITKTKTQMLAEIYRMLTLALGEPVKEFTYAFRNKEGKPMTEAKTYTPQSFYKEVVGGSLNGTFMMVMNDPRRPYHKTYEVEYDRHTYDGHNWKYLNLPMDEIEALAISQLKDGRKLYSSYDVGKQLDRKRGFLDLDNYDYGSLFGTTFNMDKAQRIETFDSGSTHAMTLTAVDLDAQGKATKWKVENSWGATWGQQGCLIMTDRWLRDYMFRLVVPNEFVTPKVKQAWQTAPVMVMPEDPLFQMDE